MIDNRRRLFPSFPNQINHILRCCSNSLIYFLSSVSCCLPLPISLSSIFFLLTNHTIFSSLFTLSFIALTTRIHITELPILCSAVITTTLTTKSHQAAFDFSLFSNPYPFLHPSSLFSSVFPSPFKLSPINCHPTACPRFSNQSPPVVFISTSSSFPKISTFWSQASNDQRCIITLPMKTESFLSKLPCDLCKCLDKKQFTILDWL